MKLFFDGAFGTYYSNLYGDSNVEFACIDYPERVLKIHKEYIDAGANAIKTNSFGANMLLSENREITDKIIKQSFSIAKEAALNKNVSVFADIGYINADDTEEEYLHITKEFISCGATHFLFETLGELKPILKSLEYIKSNVESSKIIVSFACDQNGYTGKGLYYKNLIKSALDLADYSGLNCVCGPYHTYQLLKNLDIETSRLSAMPNTSYPSLKGGRFFVYEDNKDYYSDRLLDIYSLGVGCIGGCCGSAPEYIKLFIEKTKNNQVASKNCSSVLISHNLSEKTKIKKEKSEITFYDKLTQGKKVIACELDSPLDADFTFMRESGQKLKESGCDIITVADSPLARAHADSIMTAAKIKRELNIDVLPHLACRDRNHIGIKGALLGAYIENIRNVLAITGDPVGGGQKGVYSYNSFTLIEYINQLNEQVFSENPLCVCGALNINSPNFDTELKRCEKKIKGGCKVFLTQPLYSSEAVNRLKKAKENLDIFILGGVMPIVSYKNAQFLNNEVFGINIPIDIVNKFKDKTKEESLEIGLMTAFERAKSIWNYCDGYYLMIPLKKIDLICNLINKIKSEL